METQVKCGKCTKTINDNISASIRCNKCKFWIHKKCTGLSTSAFSRIIDGDRKQPHKWVCDQCTNRDENCANPGNDGTGLETTSNKKQQYTSFQCCKTHAFLHYVCVKCYNIYHKKCISRLSKEIIHINGHKINCCSEDLSNSDKSYENSILEKTIADLAAENEQKSQYLTKLKNEKDILFQESLDMESTFEQQLENQKKIIDGLECCIRRLKRNQESKSVGTQTVSKVLKTKNKSTETIKLAMEDKGINTDKQKQSSSAVQTDELWNNITKNKIKILQQSEELNVAPSVNVSNKNLQEKKIESGKQHQHKILILGDESAKRVACLIKEQLTNYTVSAVVKPNATFEEVTFGMEKSSSSFGKNDYIIIIAGTHNFIERRKYISFRNIKMNLEACSNTNIIISSVPYTFSSDFRLNIQIYKHNTQLFRMITKLSNFARHKVMYNEINNENYRLSKHIIARQLASLIMESKKSRNLIFIETVNEKHDEANKNTRHEESEGNFFSNCNHLIQSS